MQPDSDLNALLQNGYSFQYNMPQYGPQTVVISTHKVGELALTSGRLLACDLLIVPDDRYSFKKTLSPGRYPVILSIANFHPTGETRIACAMIQISESSPVIWEIAAIDDPNPNKTTNGIMYGVDSGTGSFMDIEVSEVLAPLVWQESDDLDEFERFCSRVLAVMDANSMGKYGNASWADVKIVDGSDLNVIVFSSGWGDGGYSSFWGYDESGNLAALVTDFDLFF
jgi:hypothetical protein